MLFPPDGTDLLVVSAGLKFPVCADTRPLRPVCECVLTHLAMVVGMAFTDELIANNRNVRLRAPLMRL